MPDSHIYDDRWSLAALWPTMRAELGTIVFTNGCFDVLHAGHVAYLEEAAALGDTLVLGLNSDVSVRRLKGNKRPLNPFYERAFVLRGLRAVDLVVGFEEDTPLQLIQTLRPDILVKGGDWSPDQIVGADVVQENGGHVKSLQFKEGFSTTGLVETVLERYTDKD